MVLYAHTEQITHIYSIIAQHIRLGFAVAKLCSSGDCLRAVLAKSILP